MEEQRKEIIKSLAGVAWADGEVTEEERALLFAVCLQLGATDQEVDELEEVLGKPADVTQSLADLKAALPDKETKLNVLRVLLTMSMIDGVLSFSEFELIEKTTTELGLTSEDLESVRRDAVRAAKAFNAG